MSDCMNSKEELHHRKLKAQVRALSTNSKEERKEKKKNTRKKGRYLTVRKRESNLGSKHVLVDRKACSGIIN